MILMGGEDQHPDQRRVVLGEAGDRRQGRDVAHAGRERPTDIKHDPGPGCLDFQAAATDLVRATVDPHPHAHPRLHPGCSSADRSPKRTRIPSRSMLPSRSGSRHSNTSTGNRPLGQSKERR